MQSKARTEAACLAQFQPWQPNDPRAGTVSHSFSLNRQIAQARAEMGQDRWAELQAEWGLVQGGKDYV